LKYIPEIPPPGLSFEVHDYLTRQFNAIQSSIDALYDGALMETIEAPAGEGQLIGCTGQYYDFGDGVGVYARIDGQWYKLSMRSVTRVTPQTGKMRCIGGTPTVVVS